eukprot:Phypoly_transcript_09123.p1 GENE.Phypoly_transcript_09123~~Phypoly_transcript_09123.p1  ORF type:complete len:439 (+),score=23.51 Phypoly_transcript_09123:122-1438(+)
MIEADVDPQIKEDTPLNINIPQNPQTIKKKRIAKSTIVSACILLWTDIIGVGPLASGYYMAKGGVYWTIATIILVAITSDYTLNLMFALVHKYKQPNYVEMCAYALGRKGRFFASLFMFGYNFSGLVANLLVIGSAVPQLLRLATGSDHLLFRREFVLAFATALLLPIAFMKDIARFVVACSTTICFFLCAVGLLLYESISMNISDRFVGFQKNLSFTEPYSLHVLGGVCYVFVCHDMAFSIAATLLRPTRKRWTIVVRSCILANLVICLAVGILSYVLFVDDTQPFIPVPSTDNFPSTSNLVNFARLFLIVMIISLVPYTCYLPRLALYQLVYSIMGKDLLKREKKEIILHTILTFLTPLGALLIAEFLDDLGAVLSISGGFSAAGLGFIMPPAVFLMLEDGHWHNSHKLPYVAIFCFGSFCICLTVYSAITLILDR